VVGHVACAGLVLGSEKVTDAVFAPANLAARRLVGVEGRAHELAIVAGEELARKEVDGTDGKDKAHEQPEEEYVQHV